MKHKKSVIEVKLRLDPIPGWGHKPEDHVSMLQSYLMNIVPHYLPEVTLKGVEDEVSAR